MIKTNTYYIEKYGEELGIKKYLKACRLSFSQKINGYIEKYGEKDGRRLYNEKNNRQRKRSKNMGTLQFYIKKYGIEDGTIKYNIKNNNIKKNKPTLNTYIEKYGIEDGTLKYNIYKNKISLTLNNFIKKYGKEEGTLRWNNYITKQKNVYTDERREKKKITMKYVNSKQYYLDTYGDIYGLEKWKTFCKNQDRGSIAFFIKKHGEISGKLKWVECNKKKRFGNYYSKVSQILFMEILQNFKDIDLTQVNFATLNSEFKIIKDRVLSYDFRYKNKIIEFNGDNWHANPAFFNEDDLTISKRTAKMIWIADKYKNDIAITDGYEILIIWEHDYKNNPNECLEKCLMFLKENKK